MEDELIIDRFLIRDKIGAGSHGSVYNALDFDLGGKEVVIKRVSVHHD